MASDNPIPKRRWSRVRLAAVVLLRLPLLLGLEAYRRHRRVQWLVSEIEAVGGVIVLPEPLFQQLWRGQWKDLDVEVHVGFGGAVWPKRLEDSLGGWLLKHDYFKGLRIRALNLNSVNLSPSAFRTLIEVHPIKVITLRNLANADGIAVVLRDVASVKEVDFNWSNLTDTGLRSLPLEQLTYVGLAGTEVTPQGVSQLQRCTQLTSLAVGGAQTDHAISALLKTNAPLKSLMFEGPEIADEHLVRLHDFQLEELVLRGTSVSDEAVRELRKIMPGCSIVVGYSFEQLEL